MNFVFLHLFTITTYHYRFLDALTSRRRETQDRLAETALEEARQKCEKEASMAAQQNGSAVSAPVTPTSTPTAPPSTGIREGMAWQ